MKKILSIIVLGTLTIGAFAQSLPSLLVSSDASALGAGGVSLLGSDAMAVEGYTASSAFMDGTVAADFSYGSWQPKAAADKIIGLGATYRLLEKLSVSLGYKNFIQPAYEVTGNTGTVSQVTPTFTPKESSLAFGVAYQIIPGLSAGLTVKSTSSVLSKDAKASVFGIDLSAMYVKDNLQAAFALCNLGGKVNYGGSDYPQPALAKAAASYAVIDGLKVAGEAAYLFQGAFNLGLGAEYTYANLVSARAGYHLGNKSIGVPSYASVGLGASFAGASLNFAYLLASDTLAGSLLLGVGYAF